MEDNIMVTVNCLAFNHEKYIRQALDSVLNQKTDFKFEIVIHDDASTDGTADIIREYAEKYPDIIRPILQTENQYSKRVPIGKTFMYPLARGKYFAHCECDDYWISENKLQKQVDFLESHPDYVMCCHNSKRFYMDRNEFEIEDPIDQEGDVSARDIILEPKKRFLATASLVYRREIATERPEFFSLCPVGDRRIRLYAFSRGKVYYFQEPMSVYRRDAEESWSSKKKKDPEMRLEHRARMVEFLKEYDKYTEGRYHQYVEKNWKSFDRKNRILLSRYPEVKDTKYFKSMPLKFRFKTWFNYYFKPKSDGRKS